VHDLTGPVQDVYKNSSYLLTAVDDDGETLLDVYVNPFPDTAGDRPQYGAIGVTPINCPAEVRQHFITKREVQEIIESQFPEQQYEGPVAVRMLFEGDVYSRSSTSWYFTVGDSSSRSVAGGDYKEYLINALVMGYRELPGKVTAPESRSLIDTKKSVPGFSFYSRMVQLAEPIYFFENLNNMKAGRSVMSASNPPTPARLISVHLT
jgi:hypothetical protein